MMNYLKGSGSAIMITMLAFGLISEGFDSFNYFYPALLYVSGFGYVFGLLGLACLFLIEKKNYNAVKGYVLFLLLGIACGGGLILGPDGDFLPRVLMLTTLGSLTFLASQRIKFKVAVYTLSVFPILFIGLGTIYVGLQ